MSVSWWRVQVPKMLGVLRRRWAPEALAVSFKLETDQALLIDKVLPCVCSAIPAALELAQPFRAHWYGLLCESTVGATKPLLCGSSGDERNTLCHKSMDALAC